MADSSVRSAQTEGLRIAATVDLEEPSRLDQETLHRLCFEAKALEEKHFSEEKEQEKKKFNDDIYHLACTSAENLTRSIHEMQDRWYEAKEEEEAERKERAQSSEFDPTKIVHVEITETTKVEKADIAHLLQEKAVLEIQLMAEKEKFQTQWDNACERANNVLKENLDAKHSQLANQIEQAMGGEKVKDLDKVVSELNADVVAIAQSRPSVPEMVAKQPAAYDAVYQHEMDRVAKQSAADDTGHQHEIDKNKQTPHEAAADKVAKVAEERHDLMGQIRAAGAAREKLKGQKNGIKGALAYANGLPLQEYKQALHGDNRETAASIIGLEFELKENAKQICEHLVQDNELKQQNNPDAQVEVVAGATSSPGSAAEVADALSQDIKSYERQEKEELEAGASHEATVRFTNN